MGAFTRRDLNDTDNSGRGWCVGRGSGEKRQTLILLADLEYADLEP